MSSLIILITLIIVSCLPTPSATYAIPPPLPYSTSPSWRGQRSHLCATSINKEDSPSDSTFDETAYETDRLAKDAIAMNEMKKLADEEYAKLRTPWKWRIRRAVWDFMEENDIAQFPRYVLFASSV